MGDINEYILSKKISNFATKLGLRELITDRHGSLGPGTTRANKKQQAIDWIWVSQGVTISQGGYLPFHFSPKSNHRLLWIKCHKSSPLEIKTHLSYLRIPEDSDSTTQEAKKIHIKTYAHYQTREHTPETMRTRKLTIPPLITRGNLRIRQNLSPSHES